MNVQKRLRPFMAFRSIVAVSKCLKPEDLWIRRSGERAPTAGVDRSAATPAQVASHGTRRLRSQQAPAEKRTRGRPADGIGRPTICAGWSPGSKVSGIVRIRVTSTSRTHPTNPKFLTGSDGILLIRQEIIQSSTSNYWQQGEQRIGLGLQRSRLWHLLKAWGGFFRFQPIGHACSTG